MSSLSKNTSEILAPISIGELIDKITILEIKMIKELLSKKKSTISIIQILLRKNHMRTTQFKSTDHSSRSIY